MVWGKTRLEHLRAEFADANGGEIFDEKFPKVAEKIISKSGTRLAPYAGVHLPQHALHAGRSP